MRFLCTAVMALCVCVHADDELTNDGNSAPTAEVAIEVETSAESISSN